MTTKRRVFASLSDGPKYGLTEYDRLTAMKERRRRRRATKIARQSRIANR